MTQSLRVHIGHHFFGAGNLGDDLMLAGFLRQSARGRARLHLTCCIPFDRAPMQRRFPQVEWLPYEPAVREAAIARCDAWLGLGDTPFQTVLGDWMLDHLLEEAAWCGRLGKRMFYLGVGGDAGDLATHPKARTVATQATRIWARDRTSAALLRQAAPRAQIEIAADLAHLWLSEFDSPRPASGIIGLVLNFEERGQVTPEQLEHLVTRLASTAELRWLAQEVRPLPGSEVALHAGLPDAAKRAAPLAVPDYTNAPDVAGLLAAWGTPARLITSRYHAALIGAWAGWSTLVYPRSVKVKSAAEELGLATIESFADAAAIGDAVSEAPTASRDTLRGLAECARRSSEACLSAMLG